MSENEALIKAAEEQGLGLALESPLISTKKTRTNIGTAKRLDALEIVLQELKTIDEYHAVLGIGLGWMHRENPAKLKTSYRLWGGVYGRSEGGEQDVADRFNTWWSYMTIHRMIDKRQCAIGICAEGRTFQELGWTHSISDKTVKKCAIDGIQEFAKLNPKAKTERQPMLPKRDASYIMNISRIVIFE